MAGLRGLIWRFGFRDPAPADAPPQVAQPVAGPPQPARPSLWDLARDLEDSEACPPVLLAALATEIDERRGRAGMAEGPAPPRCSDLLVRRTGLPDWWTAGDNLLLAAAGVKVPEFGLNPMKSLPQRVVVVMGARAVFNHFNLGGEGALVVIGDRVYGAVGALSCFDTSTVLIGDGTTATNWVMLDACNGGMIVTGEDGMWAHGISLMTDDTHAIRDLATGRRLNTRGGRILIDRHVWLGEGVRILGGARIGHDSVVGAGAMVKNADIPAHSVCVGVPARVVRSSVTWSREDNP